MLTYILYLGDIIMKKLLLSVLLATVMFGGAAVEVTASANAKTEHTTKHHAKKKAVKKHAAKKHAKKATKKHAKKVVKKHVAKKTTKKKARKVAKKVSNKYDVAPKVKELAPKGVTPKGYQPYQVRHLYGNVWENVTTHEKTREINGSMYTYGRPRGYKGLKKSSDGRYYFNGETGKVYIGAGGELEW